ncbi:MAG TPA: ATP-binding cassette domain-containing protein [Myxococcota bacterium]
MPLLSFEGVAIAHGRGPLLENASFQIEPGERVCLIGRNGAGKSTLLKLVDGEAQPDAGVIWRQPGLRVARLAQDLPEAEHTTVYDAVAEGVAEVGRLLAAYHHAAHEAANGEPATLRRMEELQHEIEARGGWSLGQRVDQIVARLALPADATLGSLSGGWKRRVALARALVSEPDLLLLDEPTNHLDIEVIQWLEEQLQEFRGGVLFVTHDRALLTRLATRIVELDRGALTSWPGDYARFLTLKQAALEEEERNNALFDKKLAQEEVWIRKGIKARRTRDEGRVRALLRLREERAQRRELEGAARLAVDAGEASGKLVADVQKLSFAWGGQPLVRDLSLRIMRGDRIGLIGPNGVGKTTLLRILLGELAPATGSVRLGTRLEVAYFDQLRDTLELEKTVLENIAEGREYTEINGERRHVLSYLQDFLFEPERVRTPVKALSGGERNRLLLARLFARPANLIVMDEPTNDLDLETLELLEELLMEFPGTLLVASHDRAFLDNVVTSTLVFEGDGRVQEYVGGYSDWQRHARRAASAAKAAENSARAPAKASDAEGSPSAATTRPNKLSFKESRELADAPAKIETLEREQEELNDRVSDPAFYRSDPSSQKRVQARIAALAEEIAAAYKRWEELETRRG